MTNWERWQKYTEGLASPQNYIDWGFVYTICAALQRRVWCPPEHRRVYPNIYVTLVGKPGIGKGQVIRPVAELLSHHKLQDIKPPSIGNTPEEQQLAQMMQEATLQAANKEQNSGSKDQIAEPANVIPIAADAVTYEALVQSMSRCIRRINYTAYDENAKRDVLKAYSHSSLCFCLEEIASLFRKNTESLVNFLIQAYDCGETYEYATKTQGRDRIRRVCLNFFGGTNPDFMQDTFDDKLLSQGYSSRTFYIYAARNRKSVFFLPELTDEQKEHRKVLQEHVKKLTDLYGQVQVEQSTMNWLQEWWSDYESDNSKRASQSNKLDAYYSRRNIHTMKIAMALHFMESTEMHIPRETFERAMKFLDKEEKTMHLALVFEGKNPLASISRGIEAELSKGHATFVDLLGTFWESASKEDLEQALSGLQDLGKITTRTETDKLTDEKTVYYELVKQPKI